MATKNRTAKKSSRKRTPPRPKSLKNLPPSLKAYWRKKGVK